MSDNRISGRAWAGVCLSGGLEIVNSLQEIWGSNVESFFITLRSVRGNRWSSSLLIQQSTPACQFNVLRGFAVFLECRWWQLSWRMLGLKRMKSILKIDPTESQDRTFAFLRATADWSVRKHSKCRKINRSCASMSGSIFSPLPTAVSPMLHYLCVEYYYHHSNISLAQRQRNGSRVKALMLIPNHSTIYWLLAWKINSVVCKMKKKRQKKKYLVIQGCS